MLEIPAVQGVGVEKDGHGIVERDAMFRRVGLGLPRAHSNTYSVYTEYRGMLTAINADLALYHG